MTSDFTLTNTLLHAPRPAPPYTLSSIEQASLTGDIGIMYQPDRLERPRLFRENGWYRSKSASPRGNTSLHAQRHVPEGGQAAAALFPERHSKAVSLTGTAGNDVFTVKRFDSVRLPRRQRPGTDRIVSTNDASFTLTDSPAASLHARDVRPVQQSEASLTGAGHTTSSMPRGLGQRVAQWRGRERYADRGSGNDVLTGGLGQRQPRCRGGVQSPGRHRRRQLHHDRHRSDRFSAPTRSRTLPRSA